MSKDVYYDNQILNLQSYVGQRKIVDTLSVSIEASKTRNDSLSHMLLIGDRGSGKSTLAAAVAEELGVGMHVVSMHVIKSEGDLAAILTNILPRSILLIENFDALRSDCIEMLCTAMDDFSMDIIIGKGPSAKSIRLDLPQFTLIATMDHFQKLPKKVLDCFTIIEKMQEYSCEELAYLAEKSAAQMDIPIESNAARQLANYAKGSYRKLLHILRRSRDFAMVKGNGVISVEIADMTIYGIGENEFE